jgi:hypothetical protein
MHASMLMFFVFLSAWTMQNCMPALIVSMGDTLAMATGAYCFALYQLDKK